jgi:hypothetical protein
MNILDYFRPNKKNDSTLRKPSTTLLKKATSLLLKQDYLQAFLEQVIL